MGKRILSLILCLALCVGVIPFSASAIEIAVGTCGVNGDNLTWVLDYDGTLTISGTGAMADYELDESYDPTTPWQDWRYQIKEVIVEPGVTSIGAYAFYYARFITTVTLADTVKSIGNRAFWGCKIENITLPNQLEEIGKSALSDVATSLVIPKSVKKIGVGAFQNCSFDVTFLGDAPEIIASDYGDESIFSYEPIVKYPQNNPTWTEAVRNKLGQNAVWMWYEDNPENAYCSGTYSDRITWTLGCNGTLYLSGSGAMDDHSADARPPYYGYNGKIKEVVIGQGITSIGDYAFYQSRATSISISNTVTKIGKNAFDESSLTGITIPDSVISIGEGAFQNCSNLATVTLSENLTEIGYFVFSNCTSLTQIIIPEGVTRIAGLAFSGCKNLENVSIPSSVKTIEEASFYGCSKLTSIHIPDGVTEIWTGAFGGSGLTEIQIPGSVTTIQGGAFGGTNINEIHFAENAPNIESDAFDGVTATVYYPANNATWDSDAIQNYGGTLTYDAVGTIGGTCGAEGDNLTWTLSDDGVLTISGTGAMADFGVEEYGNEPWYIYRNLSLCKEIIKSVVIADGVTSVGYGAFDECSNLTSITIPGSVTRIVGFAFANCTNLASISISNGVKTIEEASFLGCNKLASIHFPSSVTAIWEIAFEGCTSLTNITFDGDAPTFNSGAFNGVTAIAYYPANNTTWETDAKQNYGGTLTWVAVETTDSTDSGYSAGLSSLSSDVEKGDTVTVNVNATHESDSTYAASEIIFTYDSGKLQFNEAASTLGNATVKNENGTISLQDYGESKNLGNGLYIFAFDAIADGQATVTLTSAAFVNKDNAAQSDLIAATISPSTLNFTIQKSSFGVTLPNIFTGNATVTEGESYTFTQADSTNYNYGEVTATMNGQTVTVTDNGDGSYTIANVTGAVVISGSRTEKAYTVSFSGNGAADVKDAATTATYNTAYSFTMPTASGWAYALDSITIGSKVYTGYSVADSVYTIPGSAINGDIAITITKTQTNAGVVVEGSGAGSASGNDTTVEVNKDYTLTITPEAGYTYTVTATMDGQPVEVIDNGNNTYTVKNVTGNLVFTVEKTVIVSGVSVVKYLSLDGSTMWLVKNTTPVADGKVPTYDGQAMFYSEEYNAYCYLVIAETLSEEEAQAKLGITDGTAATVDYESMDINGTGKLDASDAQLTYNIYKADYSGFTSDVTLEKFLMADVNGDGTVNLEDATAIVNKILN